MTSLHGLCDITWLCVTTVVSQSRLRDIIR